MKNIFNKIFTATNFVDGILIVLAIVFIALCVSILGRKILFIPIAIIVIPLVGFVTKYIMNKLMDLNNDK